MRPEDRVLDRLKPPDWEHVRKFPFSEVPLTAAPKGVPVVIGINWYTEFDKPERGHDNRWWIAKDGNLTTIRGGHCVCIRASEPDPQSWWHYYDQGNEGACVGFGDARMKSLLDRVRYDAFELYHATQAQGGYVGQEGAYVRDALEVLRTRGAVRAGRDAPDLASKIAAYRWALSADEVLGVLDLPMATQLGAVPVLNSWGQDYPHTVWMSAEVLERLIKEDGEVGIVTDM